jgi:hypothetical protein
MPVVLAGLLLLLCVGCGGEDTVQERFAIYHLETAIGPPREDGELRCGPPRQACPGVVEQPPPREFRYAVIAAPTVRSEHIDRSTVRRGRDPVTGAPFVTLVLTAQGRHAFARLTKEVARFGGRDQGWHHLAVVVGDEIVAFPEIDFDANPDGFPDSSGIQFFTSNEADARELVERLRGGAD